MIDVPVLQKILIALALGALIGLEREYAQFKKRGYDYAGIRTFPLISLFGAVAAYLGEVISIWVLIVGMLLTGSLSIIAYFTINKRLVHYTGATTEMAGFLAFLIGALVYYDEISLAAILAVIITVILYARAALHNFAQKIKEEELADTLKFAVIAFVILPFLPNKGYGPQEIFNPFLIWLMVVFISGISFAGYIFMKWLGEKGITIAGILGGLISSTAVTMSFAARSKKEKNIPNALILGVILANGIMFFRILLEVFVLNKMLFWQLLLPMFLLAFITAVFSYWLWRNSKKAKGKINLGSPFTLKPALQFAFFFALILALVKLAHVYFAAKGVYVISFLSGFTDVDAITVSLSQLSNNSLDLMIARDGIIIATLTNIAAKGGIAYWFGSRKFGSAVLMFFSFLIVVGVVLLLV